MSTDDGDPALWARARDGDRDAFFVLYHRHAEAVWGHGYRLTASTTAAEDVLSATFLTAWRRRADVRLVVDSARPGLLAVDQHLADDGRAVRPVPARSRSRSTTPSPASQATRTCGRRRRPGRPSGRFSSCS